MSFSIDVIETTETTVKYDLVSASPCCDAWTAEFGSEIIIKSDGIIPERLCVRRRRERNIVYDHLRQPWQYCPICGRSISVTVLQPETVRPPIIVEPLDELDPAAVLAEGKIDG